MAGKSPGGAVQRASGASLYGALLLVSVAVGWGIAWPANKLALTEIPPWTFRALGQILGAAGLFAIVRLQGGLLRVPRSAIVPIATVALLNVTLFHLLTAYGVMLMAAGRAVILIYTFPIWSVVLAYFLLAERLTPARITALALGMAAVALLVAPDADAVGDAPLGAALALLGALAFALGSVLFKKFDTNVPVVLMAGWQLLLGGIPVLIGALTLERAPDPGSLSTGVVLATLYAILIGAIYGHWAWFAALRITPSSIASIAALASPVAGVFTAAILLDEALSWRELMALALVVASTAAVLVPRGVWAMMLTRRGQHVSR